MPENQIFQTDPPQKYQDFRCLDGKGPPRKVYPANRDRNWSSPNVDNGPVATSPSGSFTYRDASQSIEIDTHTLDRYNLGDVELSLILVRRVDGKPYYRYLGHKLQRDSSWSMSKFMAATAAGVRMRKDTQGKLGLDGSVTTASGDVPVGDLITAFCYYDEKHFESNAVANWFRRLGHIEECYKLVQKIGAAVGFPEDEFGYHFESAEAPIGENFKAAGGSPSQLALDQPASPRSNKMHTMTSAEFLKRLVMFREDESTRFDGLHWEDVQTLLYGAEHSRWYPDTRRLHGMSADTATYIQQAFYLLSNNDDQFDNLAARSNGQWRIFSKMGSDGTSRFVHTGYACFPVYQDGAVKPGWGKEFIISGRVTDADGDELLAEAYRKVIWDIENGLLV